MGDSTDKDKSTPPTVPQAKHEYGDPEQIRLGTSEFTYKRKLHPYASMPLIVTILGLLVIVVALWIKFHR